MPALINTVQEMLKIRKPTSSIRDASMVQPSRNVMKLGVSNGLKNRVTGDGNKNSEANVLVKPYTPANHKKRRQDTSLDDQREKRRRMDHSVKQQCASILKGLMNHSFGKIFSEPIDPVKLNIPDYFSIVAKPMDLGTIKHKLDGDRYFDVEGFVADVRLTFSNATLCNHCGLWARSWAKQLESIFNMRWKLLEAKLKSESKNEDKASAFKAVDGCEGRYSLASHTSRLGPDCNGSGTILNAEKSPHLLISPATAASDEGCTSFKIQPSPEKALRAAMLKSRFADTIFRATHQKLQDHGEKSNLVKWKQERERLEREQIEVKARFEAEIKTAQAASQKMSYETEREAARMAIQKMRKTVDIYENLDIIKDLEKMFCCGSLSERGAKSSGSPLERLGLYIKDEYSNSFENEDEDEILDREDGEILS